ncbi:hypothetical protein E4U37_005510 [Claviceps purpurea]|nr:hypothetical protein E4U37_005510 [Claviceps purpurea]
MRKMRAPQMARRSSKSRVCAGRVKINGGMNDDTDGRIAVAHAVIAASQGLKMDKGPNGQSIAQGKARLTSSTYGWSIKKLRHQPASRAKLGDFGGTGV